MSFSSDVKAELSQLSMGKRCCRRAELAAMVRMGSTMEILSGGKLALRFDTESVEVSQRTADIIKSLYHVQGQLSMKESQRLLRRSSYSLRVASSASDILAESGIYLSGDWELDAPQLPPGRIEKPCCKVAFLRGAYLAAGTLSDPSGSYHLEIIARDDELAQVVVDTLSAFSLHAHTMVRREQSVVYIKDGDQVVDFLSLVGAHNAVLAMENVRAEKSLRNQVNRQVNCENANLDKIVDAAGKQMAAIYVLENAGVFPRLSAVLREAAELRMANPEASLQELSEMVPGMSRSAMNHRLRKLVEMAGQYQKERD